MANTKVIKHRIKTAKNISQITRAMEMVAASKMRRAQLQALSARPYSQSLKKILISLLTTASEFNHALMKENASPVTAILIIATDKGLCGGLNTNHFRYLKDFISAKELQNLKFLIIGSKGRNFILKSHFEVLADFPQIKDKVDFQDSLSVSHFLINSFLKGEIGKAYVSFPQFISTLSQKPKIVQILPISLGDLNRELGVSTFKKDYLIEPGPRQVADWLLPYFLELVIFHYLLEARAAEQSARMVAMKNASENATDIVDDLTLSYNKVRQAQITAQIAEVATAALTIY